MSKHQGITPDIIAATAWYASGATHHAHSPQDLNAWPNDGVLIIVLYDTREITPGRHYRQVLMGNDTYFFVPHSGVFGHNDDPAETVRARYGSDTLVWRGMWTTNSDFQRVIDDAMSAEAVP